jgi:hypothetical protein
MKPWEEPRSGGDEQKAGDSGQKTEKNPNLKRLGSSTTTTPLAPFPSKGSPVENQAGFLARGTHLLSAPSQGLTPQWLSQISFRSQLRGSDGFAPSSLLTASGCEATWLSSTRKLFCYPSVVSTPCQTDKNEEQPRAQSLPLRCSRTLINCLNTSSQKARKCRGMCSESV